MRTAGPARAGRSKGGARPRGSAPGSARRCRICAARPPERRLATSRARCSPASRVPSARGCPVRDPQERAGGVSYRTLSSRFQDVGYGAGEFLPSGGLDVELPAPFGGEPVELGAPVVFGGTLLGGDPASPAI